jgi:hypothetical protein
MASGDTRIAYGSSSAVTITLASLAAGSTLLAGRGSDAIDNSTNLYLDYLAGGKITTGTTPTAGTIEVWAYGLIDDTPTYPDVFDGVGSAETVTSADIKRAALKLLASIPTDTTSNRTYWFGPVSIAAAFGGSVPKKFGFFVTHSTVAALNATAGNHAIFVTPVYMVTTP